MTILYPLNTLSLHVIINDLRHTDQLFVHIRQATIIQVGTVGCGGVTPDELTA